MKISTKGKLFALFAAVIVGACAAPPRQEVQAPQPVLTEAEKQVLVQQAAEAAKAQREAEALQAAERAERRRLAAEASEKRRLGAERTANTCRDHRVGSTVKTANLK